MEIYSYYIEQLKRIELPKSEYAPKIKIAHESGDTNWINLNDDSATAIVRWLEKHYNVSKR